MGEYPPPSLMVLKRLAPFFLFLATGTKAVDTFIFFLLVQWLSLSALIIHKDVKNSAGRDLNRCDVNVFDRATSW